MQNSYKKLEQSLFAAISQLQNEIRGAHLVWDLDSFDRFVIDEIHFGGVENRTAYIAALSGILDDHFIKGAVFLENARADYVDPFIASGFADDGKGLHVRQGLSQRDEYKELKIRKAIADLDRRFQDVYCEWKFVPDGHLLIEHLETASSNPTRRDAYLEIFKQILDENEMDCVAQITDINHRAEYAGLFEVMGFIVDYETEKATRLHGEQPALTI